MVSTVIHRDTERNKEIAFLEAQVYEYVEILGVSVDVSMLLLELMFPAGREETTLICCVCGYRSKGS